MAKYKPGDVIKDSGLFANMSPEQITMTCVEVVGIGSKFDVEYYGVKIGQASHMDDEGGEFWEWRG